MILAQLFFKICLLSCHTGKCWPKLSEMKSLAIEIMNISFVLLMQNGHRDFWVQVKRLVNARALMHGCHNRQTVRGSWLSHCRVVCAELLNTVFFHDE